MTNTATVDRRRSKDMAVTESRAIQKSAEADENAPAVKIDRIVSIKTMLRDEHIYRRQRHQNFLHLFDSKRGRKWLRLYFLLSCPLPIALGICLALVKSSLMLIGVLVFSTSLLSFVSSLIGALIELVDATRAFNVRKANLASPPTEDTQSQQIEIPLEEIAERKLFGGDAAMDELIIRGTPADKPSSYVPSEQQGEARRRFATGGNTSSSV
jgi:hemin uptake protein HemP